MAFGFNNSQNRNDLRSSQNASQAMRPMPQNPRQKTWNPTRQEPTEGRPPMWQPSQQTEQGRQGMQQPRQSMQGMWQGTQGMQQPRQGMQPGTQQPRQGMQPGAQPPRQGMQPGTQQPRQGMQQGTQQPRQGMQQGAQQPRQGMQQPGAQQPPRQGMQPGAQQPRQGMQPGAQQPRQGMQQGTQQPRQGQPGMQPNGGLPDPKSLPDGVTYQPLDERTIAEISRFAPDHPALAALRENRTEQAANQTPPASAPALPQLMPLNNNGTMDAPAAPAFPFIAEPPLPPVESRLLEGLEKSMQNERNGVAYYNSLAAIAETRMQSDILGGIGEGCRERERAYNKLYRKYRAADFETRNNPVIGTGSFRQGLHQAVVEENRSIKDLIRMYEDSADDARHVLSTQIYKKMSDLNFLQLILSEK